MGWQPCYDTSLKPYTRQKGLACTPGTNMLLLTSLLFSVRRAGACIFQQPVHSNNSFHQPPPACLIQYCPCQTALRHGGCQGTVFDHYVDEANCCMAPWEQRVPTFTYYPDSFSSLFVPTVETTRLTYFMDSLVANRHYVMFVGGTGACRFRDGG